MKSPIDGLKRERDESRELTRKMFRVAKRYKDEARQIEANLEYWQAQHRAVVEQMNELIAENERLHTRNKDLERQVGEFDLLADTVGAENERLQRENSELNIKCTRREKFIETLCKERDYWKERHGLSERDYDVASEQIDRLNQRIQLLETREDREAMADMLRERRAGNEWEVKYIIIPPTNVWHKSSEVYGYINDGWEVLGTTGYIMWFRRAVNKAASEPEES